MKGHIPSIEMEWLAGSAHTHTHTLEAEDTGFCGKGSYSRHTPLGLITDISR